MTALHRRDHIIDRIEDTGFVLDHKPNPCHLWTGPDSGTGRGGGYGRMSLDGQTVAVHRLIHLQDRLRRPKAGAIGLVRCNAKFGW